MQELKREECEAIDGFLNSRKRTRLDYRRNHHSKKIDTIENEIEASQDLQRNKILVELNTPQGSAVRQIAVKPQTNVKCTTRFLAGKMLMFAKLSLKSFIYQLSFIFRFPTRSFRLFTTSIRSNAYTCTTCLLILTAPLYNSSSFLA